jgi:site-specific DNA recombinase
LIKKLKRLRPLAKSRLNFFSARENGMAEDETKQELKELFQKEESLNIHLQELTNLLKNTQNTEYNMNLMMDAVQYYLSKSQAELTFAEKGDLIRQVVRKIRVYGDAIETFTF